MEKIISYPLSVIYYLLFGITLVFFHVVQWICFNLFGYKAHKKSVDVLSFFLVFNTYILGTRYKISGLEKLPTDSPLIIASNHQSLYDITSICWFQCAKFIPSLSVKSNWAKVFPVFRTTSTTAVRPYRPEGSETGIGPPSV